MRLTRDLCLFVPDSSCSWCQGWFLFMGELVRQRNVLSTTMYSVILLGAGPVFWAVTGYSLVFGRDIGGLIGSLDFILLSRVGMETNGPVDNLPHIVFMSYQCMFSSLTPALISGAYAERMRFSAMVLFSVLWLLFVYSPLAHLILLGELWCMLALPLPL